MLLALSVISDQGAALGPTAYKVFDERGGTIGRVNSNDWVLPDAEKLVSSRHANIKCISGAFYLEDASTNGTYLNGTDRRLAKESPARLQDGDRIQIGEYQILVQLIDDTAPGVDIEEPESEVPFDAESTGVNELDDPAHAGQSQTGAYGFSAHGAQRAEEFDEHGNPLPADAHGLNNPTHGAQRSADASGFSSPAQDGQQPTGISEFGDPARAGQPLSTATLPFGPSGSPAARAAAAMRNALRATSPGASSGARGSSSSQSGTSGGRAGAGGSFGAGGGSSGTSGSFPAGGGSPASSGSFGAGIGSSSASGSYGAGAGSSSTGGSFGAGAGSSSASGSYGAGAGSPVAGGSYGAGTGSSPAGGSFGAGGGSSSASGSFAMGAGFSSANAYAPPRSAIPPVAGPLPANPPEPTVVLTGTPDDLLLLLGLDPQRIDPTVYQQLGHILRIVVQGLIDVLNSRAEVKSQFRMPMTNIRPVENNPLKFSMNADDALHNLFIKRNPGYLPPTEAFREGFQDIAFHQMAMLAGVRAAFNSMLASFHPDHLADVYERKLKRASFFSFASFANRLRYWGMYRAQYEDIEKNMESHFQSMFGEEFAKAYSEQLQQLGAAARQGTR